MRYALICSVALSLAGAAVSAAEFPARPIRLVVPYPAGGPTDATARAIVPKLAAALGQSVIVDNRGGAGSIVGTDIVAKAAPDGYTLLLFTTANAINASLMSNLPYDMQKDFAMITMLAVLTSIVVVHPSLPVQSINDLVSLARAKPGQLSYASAGHGTPMHLAGELFKSMAGINIAHIPYKGSAPAIVELISGQVQLSLIGASPVLLSHIKGGRLRALAVTNAKRSALLPELPTMNEAGLRGYESEGWHALGAPARTPKAVVDRIYREVEVILGSPDTKAYLLSNAAEPVGMPPDQFAAKLKDEIAKWERVVKAANMKVD